jgi:ABC-type antimicrobial peptide transport system permease subunit
VAIARYEERHLFGDFGEEYRQYKQKVPFLFPVRCPGGISEMVFTILIAIVICVVFALFPFYLIRIV